MAEFAALAATGAPRTGGLGGRGRSRALGSHQRLYGRTRTVGPAAEQPIHAAAGRVSIRRWFGLVRRGSVTRVPVVHQWWGRFFLGLAAAECAAPNPISAVF